MPALKLFEVFVKFEVRSIGAADAEALVEDFVATIQRPGGVKIPTQIGEFAVDCDKTEEIED